MATLAPSPARTVVPRRPRVAPTPRWWRDAVGVACWTTALLVAALWIRGRGLQALNGTAGGALTSLGRVTGLVAADLLLVQVFLMARVPWVERSYGQDELARRHRLVGFWSFNLLVGHVVLITLGYGLADRRSWLPELWYVLTHFSGMLLASLATAALVLVSVTSVRLARKKLRYETWHLLHLYAYLGVGLSIPHELWTGADFRTSSLARAYWLTTYLVAAGAVVVFRVGTPLWRTAVHGLRVHAVERESDDVVSVRVRGRHLHRLPVRSGQFFVWRFLDGPGWSRGNPYSLSAAPRSDELRITAKDLGDGSSRLAYLRPGTRVLVEGPYGRLTGEHRVTDKVAMLACGIGITPLRALLEDLPYAPGDATLVYRARSEPDLVLREELELLAARRGIVVHYLLGPRITARRSWLPRGAERHRDRDVLLHLVPDLRHRDLFVCGPEEWTDAVVVAARRAGLPREQLHQERFAW
jgi:predicted ferric reductase